MYFAEMDLLARELVRHQIRIIFGGARVGLMGRLADTALSLGGEVIGVIPQYMNQPETVHTKLTELLVVNDLLDRKRKMLELSDAVIASPGGVGTMDEITEIIALKQVGEHAKPIVFHNYLDFWRPLLEFFEELQARAMLYHDPQSLYFTHESAHDVVQALVAGVSAPAPRLFP